MSATKIRVLVLLLLAAVALNLGQAAPAQAAYRFGNGPYDDAWHWAGIERCSGVSQSGLTALMLSASIAETVGGPGYTPAPMTLGRADAPSVNSNNVNLFESKNVNTPYRRAHWHPGVGSTRWTRPGLARLTRLPSE